MILLLVACVLSVAFFSGCVTGGGGTLGASRWDYLPTHYAAALRIGEQESIDVFGRAAVQIGRALMSVGQDQRANRLAIALSQELMTKDRNVTYPEYWTEAMGLLSQLSVDSLTARVALEDLTIRFEAFLQGNLDPEQKSRLLVRYFYALEPAEMINEDRIRWLLDQLLIMESDRARVLGLVDLAERFSETGNSQDLHTVVQHIIPLIPSLSYPVERARVALEASYFSSEVRRPNDADRLYTDAMNVFSEEPRFIDSRSSGDLYRLLERMAENGDYGSATAVANLVQPAFVRAAGLMTLAEYAIDQGDLLMARRMVDVVARTVPDVVTRLSRIELFDRLLDTAADLQDVSFVRDLEPLLAEECPGFGTGKTEYDESSEDAVDPCIQLEAARIGALLLSQETEQAALAVQNVPTLQNQAWGAVLVLERLVDIGAQEAANLAVDWALQTPVEYSQVPPKLASRWAVVLAKLQRYSLAMEVVAEAGTADAAIDVFLQIPPDYALTEDQEDMVERIRTYF